MLKKALSIFLSILILISSVSAFSMSAEASTSYKTKLKNKGFPDSYISYLVNLHKEFPKWEFVAFKTGLDWSEAVAGERSTHSKQVVQKGWGFSDSYRCKCSKCIGRINNYEAPASEAAVKYYMDPRNWLDEKSILQFESTEYNSNQTKDGVESILSTSFMHNAYITYKDSSGQTHTYTNKNGKKVKYSTAIMQAAKDSDMSAYYLASKIVIEVGGAKQTAGGVSGTYRGYEGIYNFYSIGANSGARDGLKWASKDGYQTNDSCYLREEPSSNSKAVKKLSSGKSLNYISKTSKQSDGYVWYKVSVTVKSKTYEGYIRSDLVKTDTYGRPWTTPYKSIYYGAKFISNNFKTQFTSYLQKFNVNPESGSLHNHEYMTSINGATHGANVSYKAYVKAGILKDSRVFYIPVYMNMSKYASPEPGTSSSNSDNSIDNSTNENQFVVTGLKLTSRKTESLSYKWDKISGASQYYIYIKNETKGTTFSKTVSTNYASLNKLTPANQYTVKVKAYRKGKWSDYSVEKTRKTRPEKASGLKVVAVYPRNVKLKWNKVYNADGYLVYRIYKNGKTKKYLTVKGGNSTSATVKGLYGGNKYRFKVVAYVDNGSIGKGSNSVLVKTNPRRVSNVKLIPSATTIKVKWSKVDGKADGYLVSFARDKAFKDEFAVKDVVGQKSTSYTGKNLTKGHSYYVRVRSYKKIGKKTYYGKWSKVNKVTCK